MYLNKLSLIFKISNILILGSFLEDKQGHSLVQLEQHLHRVQEHTPVKEHSSLQTEGSVSSEYETVNMISIHIYIMVRIYT